MSNAPVSTPGYDRLNEKPFGPAVIEHMTAASGLEELGTYFMEFHSGEYSDPWTLEYEETIYVIEGCARLRVHEQAGVRDVVAKAGAVVVLPKGSTVEYGALVGSRFLLSISPVNWRDRA